MGIEIPRKHPVPRNFADSAESSYARLRQPKVNPNLAEALKVLVALGLKQKEGAVLLEKSQVAALGPTATAGELAAVALKHR